MGVAYPLLIESICPWPWCLYNYIIYMATKNLVDFWPTAEKGVCLNKYSITCTQISTEKSQKKLLWDPQWKQGKSLIQDPPSQSFIFLRRSPTKRLVDTCLTIKHGLAKYSMNTLFCYTGYYTYFTNETSTPMLKLACDLLLQYL